MGHFIRQLNAHEIKQGYALLSLMEHLDREMDLLNQQRIHVGASSQEGNASPRSSKAISAKFRTASVNSTPAVLTTGCCTNSLLILEWAETSWVRHPLLPVVYHPHHSAPLPSTHRFPMAKFRLLHQLLLEQGVVQANEVHRPLSIARRDLESVHPCAYHEAFSRDRLTRPEQRRIGLPATRLGAAHPARRGRHPAAARLASSRAAWPLIWRAAPPCPSRLRERLLHLQRLCRRRKGAADDGGGD